MAGTSPNLERTPLTRRQGGGPPADEPGASRRDDGLIRRMRVGLQVSLTEPPHGLECGSIRPGGGRSFLLETRPTRNKAGRMGNPSDSRRGLYSNLIPIQVRVG